MTKHLGRFCIFCAWENVWIYVLINLNVSSVECRVSSGMIVFNSLNLWIRLGIWFVFFFFLHFSWHPQKTEMDEKGHLKNQQQKIQPQSAMKKDLQFSSPWPPFLFVFIPVSRVWSIWLQMDKHCWAIIISQFPNSGPRIKYVYLCPVDISLV